jgi:hypothetical protein
MSATGGMAQETRRTRYPVTAVPFINIVCVVLNRHIFPHPIAYIRFFFDDSTEPFGLVDHRF